MTSNMENSPTESIVLEDFAVGRLRDLEAIVARMSNEKFQARMKQHEIEAVEGSAKVDLVLTETLARQMS